MTLGPTSLFLAPERLGPGGLRGGSAKLPYEFSLWTAIGCKHPSYLCKELWRPHAWDPVIQMPQDLERVEKV